jgi:hypothetical protein
LRLTAVEPAADETGIGSERKSSCKTSKRCKLQVKMTLNIFIVTIIIVIITIIIIIIIMITIAMIMMAIAP